MIKKKSLTILFVGNSHTYMNDMPAMVRQRAVEAGYECRVVMIAHGGWFLAQHAEEPEVRFNIVHGRYDYVVLQEHAQPFGPAEKFREAAVRLNEWIRDAGSTPVVYGCWARADAPEVQAYMNEVHRQVAAEIGALLAPVGEHWWEYQESHPEVFMYKKDGGHASAKGSAFAAEWIWKTIREDLEKRGSRLYVEMPKVRTQIQQGSYPDSVFG